MGETTQTDNTTVKEAVTQGAPASTPPMPFPAERLIGEHLKANMFDFGLGFPLTGFAAYVNTSYGRLQALGEQMVSDSMKLSTKILTDSQDLAVKIKSDAASHAKTLDVAVAGAVQTGLTLNQQNINPVSQGEGESADAQSYPPNRAIDSNTALGTGVVTSQVASVLAAWLQSQIAVAPVVITASGGASTPSQTKPPTAS